MYPIREGSIKINETIVDTYGRAAIGKSTAVHVVSGTTGFKGSNKREAGGRTYVKIECCCGDFHFIPIKDEVEGVTGIEIACCGDEGLEAMVKAIEFVRTVLKDQCCEVND